MLNIEYPGDGKVIYRSRRPPHRPSCILILILKFDVRERETREERVDSQKKTKSGRRIEVKHIYGYEFVKYQKVSKYQISIARYKLIR